MSYTAKFEYIICYEDREVIHTSRWKIEGLDSRSDGNTERGWLWLSAETSGDTATVSLYGDPGGSNLVMRGSGDISGLADEPVRVTLSEQDASGLSGELWLESLSDDAMLVPVLVSLVVDEDLAEEWHDLDELPADIYSVTHGMAVHCAASTRKTLLLASQMFAGSLGGYGGPEDRRLASAARFYPDYRRIVVPDQLKEVAVCWALELALGSKHQRHEHTMYSHLRDYFAEKRRKAIASWNLTFNINPSTDDDADTAKSIRMTQPRRL